MLVATGFPSRESDPAPPVQYVKSPLASIVLRATEEPEIWEGVGVKVMLADAAACIWLAVIGAMARSVALSWKVRVTGVPAGRLTLVARMANFTLPSGKRPFTSTWDGTAPFEASTCGAWGMSPGRNG